MQTGKLKESVWKRSVVRQLHLNMDRENKGHEEKLAEPAISSSGPIPGFADMPWRQVTAAANSLAGNGAEGELICLQGLLPETLEESILREDMRQFGLAAEAYGMRICEADIQVSDQIRSRQYFVTVTGRKNPVFQRGSQTAEELHLCGGGRGCVLQPGQELIVARPIALAGTAALARIYEEKLQERFPHWLIDRAKGFERWMSVTEAARAVYHFGACPVQPLSQGGIFNALWDMAERAGVGLEVDLRKIPVKQETIEICECFDVNPYYLYSEGTLLIGTWQAEALIAALQESEIPACVIGRVTDQNDRIIQNGENRRFLDRPKQDELWRLGRGAVEITVETCCG